MAHRATRRAENALHASAAAAESRAACRAARSGQKPVANQYTAANAKPFNERPKKFDYEEYLTRLADRKAGDPEFQKKSDAFKRRRRERMDAIRAVRDLEFANIEMDAEVKHGESVGVSRIRQIWYCVIHEDNEQKWRQSATLSQEARIAVTPRIRGCGLAAKKAGFTA